MRDRVRGLYAITPEGLAPDVLLDRCERALHGGARLVQLRDKHADAATGLALARALKAACDRTGALFIVNDDVALARAAGAHGVHVGRDDAGIAHARAALGPHALVGASCYDDLDRARRCAAEGADYLAFGSVYPSPTKPLAVRAPLALFAAARPFGCPLVAIGGITLAHAPAVIDAGADALAVVTDVFDAPDIAARAAAYARLFPDQEPFR